MEAELGEKLGITKLGTANIIKKTLKKYDLPTKVEMNNKKVKEFLKADKKMETENQINVILLREIGKCEIHRLSLNEVLQHG